MSKWVWASAFVHCRGGSLVCAIAINSVPVILSANESTVHSAEGLSDRVTGQEERNAFNIVNSLAIQLQNELKIVLIKLKFRLGCVILETIWQKNTQTNPLPFFMT